MMVIVWLVIATLFAWRVTAFLAYERGPFGLGVRIRSLVGVHHKPDGSVWFDSANEVLLNPVTPWPAVDNLLHEIARGMTCVWCCSVWVSLAVALLLARVSPMVYDTASYVLIVGALSAVVIVVQTVIDRLRR
jgi:hypothetical protein